MKRSICLVALVSLPVSAAFAQGMGMGGPQTITLSAGLQRSWGGVKMNLTQGAEKMPEDQFGFKPTPEVRAFAQLYGHVANSMYGACAAVKGEANPNQGNDLEKQVTKAEVTRFLADVLAYCDPAFAGTTEENVLQLVKQGQNEVARAQILAGLIAHDNEIYGTSVVYLRLKGIVPPSTERAQAPRRPSEE